MNPRQLEYAIMLSEVKNFSQLAEMLDISQPALSKHIRSLETDIGIQIFDRNTSPLSLTPAGEYFIEEAKDILYKEQMLRRSMERFKTGEEGLLRIGITPFRCTYMMPEIAKKVRQKFPGVTIEFHETSSDQLRKEAGEGKYDFAIVNLPVDESLLDIIPLEKDELMLAVPKEMAGKLPTPNETDKYPVIDFKDCVDLQFVTLGKKQEMRILFDKLCTKAGIRPNIASEVVSITSAWAMAREGVGAALLPLQFMDGTFFDDNLVLYKIKDNNYTRQPVIVTSRGQMLSEYAKFAIEELKNQR